MNLLHVIKNIDDEYALRVAAEQGKKNKVTVILMHDAVFSRIDDNFKEVLTLYTCKSDVEARGIDTGLKKIDYDRIVSLIFENDSVLSW